MTLLKATRRQACQGLCPHARHQAGTGLARATTAVLTPGLTRAPPPRLAGPGPQGLSLLLPWAVVSNLRLLCSMMHSAHFTFISRFLVTGLQDPICLHRKPRL